MPATIAPRRTTLATPTIYKLANKVTVIAEQIPVDAVNLNIWVNVGSSAETDDINGMAHFLEHMIFKGTAKQQAGEFERAIEFHGGNTNAATSQDYTHYYITVAPSDFAQLAPLQIDLVLNASIPDPEFQRERQVVLEEIRRSQDNAGQRIYRHTMELAHEHLPYRRPVLGPVEVISQLTSEQMRTFHRTWYTPENITVAVVGNLPVAEMVDVITKAFDTQVVAIAPEQTPWQPEPSFTTVVRKEIIDPTLQQARLAMTWRVPGLIEIAQTYPLNILASILGGGRTSRLVKDLREERGLVDRISVHNSTHKWQGIFQISAQLSVENIPEVETRICEHLQHLQDELVTTAELEKIRTQVTNRFIFGTESPKDRTGIYGYYDRIVGNLDVALTYPEIIKAITDTDLQTIARTYLSPDAYGVLIVKP